jgi:hypothetical protein
MRGPFFSLGTMALPRPLPLGEPGFIDMVQQLDASQHLIGITTGYRSFRRFDGVLRVQRPLT